ncbi:G-protein coupled receptor Mth-like [Drosophila sulfurigaster albostrigata]|uniref:G-protein coupled receptor Mth-like n=1 Tax=Drosophila sulfurigaster albostrigata TaxID=89887 RepID=UPI002D21C88B|nr:G-protein coupled receptor Mth-like [Drosophila sulfurigaster albostrigata]
MFTIINALFILKILVAVAEDSQECGYFDTVDLSDSQRRDDGSYLYNDILIPSEKVQEYSYRITVFDSNKTVDPYMRGCLCHIKSCVLLCCEPTNLMQNKISLNMTLINGTESQVDVRNEFVVQVKYEIPCDVLDDPNYNEQTQPDWKLFQDGTLYNLTSNSALEKQDYCLMPHKLDENYYLLPQIIKKDSETLVELDIISVIRVISVFCIVIIIGVYLYLPHLRSRAYSQCCLYYFICLVISFILLLVEPVARSKSISISICYFIGNYNLITKVNSLN